MSMIHRYIGGAILRSFLFAVFLLLFVFTLITTFRLLREDLTISQLFKVLPFAVFYTLPYLLPIALLIAVTLTFGRLVADREVLAMRASGISSLKIMIPGFIPGVLLTLLALPLESTMLPALHWQTWAITSTAIEEFLTLGSGQHKSARFPHSNFDLYIREFKNGELSGVLLRKTGNNQDIKIVASSGRLSVNKSKQKIDLDLQDVSVTIYVKDREGNLLEHSRVRVKSFKQDIPLVRTRRLSTKDVSSRELKRSLDEMAEGRIVNALHGHLLGSTTHFSIDRRVRADLEIRSVTPFASIVFVLIGVPIALLLGSENRLVPLFLSFLVVTVFFFVPFTVSKSIAGKGQLPLLWLWLGPACGVFAGLILTAWATRK